MKTAQQFALAFVVLSLLGRRASAAITSTDEMNRAASQKQIPISGSSFSVAAAAENRAETAPAKTSESIPWSQVGAKAGADYQGDGLTIMPITAGARLRCVFQKMEGEVTREGLWLASTVIPPGGTVNDRFRVMAIEVGRVTPCAPFENLTADYGAHGVPRPTIQLPRTGTVQVADKLVRFLRPGLTEEYSVSMDGVRQDFIIEQRPVGAGPLRVELEVAGAKVEPLADGARLVLENSGREIAYNRLRVTDATGKELPARMEVVEGARRSRRFDSAMAKYATPSLDATESETLKRPEGRAPMLAVLVNDADALYPLCIDPTFSDANWISMGGIPGPNGSVSAAVVDGSGNLYIGGGFTQVGDVFANHIAKWNGSSWTALGSGIVPSLISRYPVVKALAVSGNDLYAGGDFTTAGGIAANGIAKWNGSSWTALGSGMDGDVRALAVSGSDVYAGGGFKTAGGSTANSIAKWNGSSWTALGSGIGGDDPSVSALAVSGSDVYAAGAFTTAGGSAANSIAKWNGSSWSALGLGMGNLPGYSTIVYALAVSGSDVYAGGFFTTAGGSAANNIAKWNGSSWSALGSGMGSNQGIPPSVSALAVSGSNVYAGGAFTTAGGSAANHIAKWNGSSWSALGSGMSGGTFPSADALAVSGSDVYAGGVFSRAGGVNIGYAIAKWNGSSWSALNSGMNGGVSALALSGSDLYAGGDFTTAGGSTANYIAKWNGSSWSALGSGLNGEVSALVVSGSDLYAGGDFETAGGSAANYIAKWDGSNWSALGSGMSGATPAFGGPYVNALAVSGSDVYAGGAFTTAGGSAATNIAKWNGSSWSALGSGINGQVLALAVSGSNVYAAGDLVVTAGGRAASYIAKWDGSSWSALGSGMNGRGVIVLAVSGSDLYAGGYFTTAGGTAANSIAKWNGSRWSALGSGMDGGVGALAVSGSDLYAGGYFTTAGGTAANSIAKWNGSSWSALGSGIGINDGVYALALSGSDLYAGGRFTTAGGKVSAYIARAYLLTLPALSVLRSGSEVIVSWPSVDTTGFGLEQAGTLAAPAGWVANTASVTDNGTNRSVTVPATNSPQLFRLRRP